MNGDVKTALINEHFNAVKKMFEGNEGVWQKIETMQVYLIRAIRGLDDADEILKENLIGINKIMVNDKMIDDKRKKNSDDLNVVKNVIIVSAMINMKVRKKKLTK